MDSLPDELLHEILTYSLCLQHVDFLDYGYYRKWLPRPSGRLAAHLLVEKRWLRVGTPLLYECLHLKKPEHTAAVARLFRTHPCIGAAVRCLRLDGGLEEDLVDVAKHIPGLRCLYINLEVASMCSIAELQEAMALLKPAKLYIKEFEYGLNSKKGAHARELLYDYMRSLRGPGPALRTVSLSDDCSIGRGFSLRKFAQALEQSCVEEFVCDADDVKIWVLRGKMRKITKVPSLKRIVCRGLASKKSIEQLLQMRNFPPTDMQKFSFVHGGENDELEEWWDDEGALRRAILSL